jgi:outer membrane protein OmpA-like peptidoglycan-associated protein
MQICVSKSVSRILALALLALAHLSLAAQETTKPAAKASPDDSATKWDIFGGYSYIAPHGTIATNLGGGNYVATPYSAITPGGIVSVARYFNRNVGVEAIGDLHLENESQNPWVSSKDDMSGLAVGLISRFPTADITPFVHALVGGDVVGGPYGQPDTWGMAVTAGGGLDYHTPLFHHRLSLRIFQADYQYVHVNFGPGYYEGRANINAARLSAGVVIGVGGFAPPPPVTLACSASPSAIFPGDPVTVTATAGDLNPKLTAVYTWSGDGVTGNGTTATVATGSLAAGNYTVKGNVKEGPKPGQSADCSASYTVRAYEPPTISCSASPSTINPGDSSTVTSVGVSPQNRPLTYGYSATAGSIGGSGTTATFNSAGAPSGVSSITCTVTDDKGQTATGNANVTITTPPPPAGPPPEQVRLEARLALHSVFFPTAQPTAAHPEGGLVTSQQGTLTSLATDFKSYLAFKPDAHLVLSGHADVRGSEEYNQKLSDRRVARAKQFLVEQGVPEGSIETRGLGKEQELTADQVKDLVEKNPELSESERAKVLNKLNVIVLAQNRRVDVTLSTTGQQSVRLYPFNAADSLTLLDEKSTTPRTKAAAKKGK